MTTPADPQPDPVPTTGQAPVATSGSPTATPGGPAKNSGGPATRSGFPERRLILAVGATAFGAGAWWSWETLQPRPVTDTTQAALEHLLATEFPDWQGKATRLQAWSGKVLALNFWATWCPPCIEEMPELSALANELRPKGAEVLGIGIDSAANIRQFAEKHRFSYPLLVAGAGALELIRSLGNESGGLPFTVIVDRRGRLVDRILGRVNIGRLRAQVLELAAA